MLTEAHNLIPSLSLEDITHYVATHEFREVGDKQWFRLVPYNQDLFRTPEYGFFSGREFTTGDMLWIASGLNTVYQTRPIVS